MIARARGQATTVVSGAIFSFAITEKPESSDSFMSLKRGAYTKDGPVRKLTLSSKNPLFSCNQSLSESAFSEDMTRKDLARGQAQAMTYDADDPYRVSKSRSGAFIKVCVAVPRPVLTVIPAFPTQVEVDVLLRFSSYG